MRASCPERSTGAGQGCCCTALNVPTARYRDRHPRQRRSSRSPARPIEALRPDETATVRSATTIAAPRSSVGPPRGVPFPETIVGTGFSAMRDRHRSRRRPRTASVSRMTETAEGAGGPAPTFDGTSPPEEAHRCPRAAVARSPVTFARSARSPGTRSRRPVRSTRPGRGRRRSDSGTWRSALREPPPVP